MTRARFDELLADRRIIKANDKIDFQCITVCKRFKIGVYLNPSELRNEGSKLMLNKPFLGVFPSYPRNSSIIPVLDQEIVFLMFSEDADKAFTYRLTMDITIGEAFLKILDFPNEHSLLISEREINGISKAILPEHEKYTGMSPLPSS